MDTFLPGAKRIDSSHDGGSMVGTNAYLTWHTFEADPAKLSATQGAKALIKDGNEVHFCLNPQSGELVQILPANRAGRGLENHDGGVQTNRAGRVHLQVEVIGFALSPFTSTMTAKGTAAVHALSAFARSLGVPDVFPAGQPAATAAGPHNRIAPGPSGHYGHSQWRENSHFDPGHVDTAKLFAPAGVLPLLGPVVDGTLTHVVVKGDTLFSLALHFHTTVAALQTLNGIADPTKMPIGLVLRIPQAA